MSLYDEYQEESQLLGTKPECPPPPSSVVEKYRTVIIIELLVLLLHALGGQDYVVRDSFAPNTNCCYYVATTCERISQSDRMPIGTRRYSSQLTLVRRHWSSSYR